MYKTYNYNKSTKKSLKTSTKKSTNNLKKSKKKSTKKLIKKKIITQQISLVGQNTIEPNYENKNDTIINIYDENKNCLDNTIEYYGNINIGGNVDEDTIVSFGTIGSVNNDKKTEYIDVIVDQI